ncbi:GTPase HflX [Odoribacter sp. AF15-53]|mgnify:FL=1|uniref:GTPase HflX n=1 Tax=Odoribacter sp. AF15-53 TaxID=2292236 RepID=UPI000E4E82EE|nr:GTPase HflX [Odoribacter sp. AF15-53]RHR78476.1 GTPase HflX [Odoribacter sp. AF15-53]
MSDYFYTKKEAEKAILVGVALQSENISYNTMCEYLDELAFLAETAGAETVKIFTQNLDKPVTATFVGKGKLEEIRNYVEENDIDLVIFDDELSPTQIRNIDRELPGRKVLDRTTLILDIFAKRARTAEAKAQVELAQYQYMLPRLTGMWTHLERQKGGIGLRGPGESEIETDRRIIRDKITRLKEQLAKIDKQMTTQRKNRGKLVRVALVGYTNVGKSTLMNLLSKSEVFAENKLFATLDTTVRKIAIKNVPLLLADTVGFIRKLPHHLVESFKSTLDEVREADVILHVVDISHPQFEDQVRVVNETLSELLDKTNKPTITVFNKIDAFTYTKKDEDDLTPIERKNYSLEDLKQMWMSKQGGETVYISARSKENIEELKDKLYDIVKDIHSARFPFNDFLYQDFEAEEETED